MTVVCCSNMPSHLSGYVSRFLVEVRAGVFVGKTSQKVAAELWKKIEGSIGEGEAVLVRPDSAAALGASISSTFSQGWVEVDIGGVNLPMRLFAGKKNPFGKTMKIPKS